MDAISQQSSENIDSLKKEVKMQNASEKVAQVGEKRKFDQVFPVGEEALIRSKTEKQ